MSTYEISDSEVSVHICTFQGYFQRAKVNLRFPSLFFVEWKSMNAKNSVGMIGRKRAVNSQIDLDQTLTFTTEMIYHKGQSKYMKKQSLIHLNLISNSRPDQAKLVGRIAVDLSEIANINTYSDLRTTKLMYCSVEADLTFRISMTRAIESNMLLNELDRSAFSDLYSFTGPKSGYRPRLEFKDNASERRMEEEKKKIKTRLSEKEEVAQRNGKTPSRKGEKILIQEHEEYENRTANSLPLTQKKKDLRRQESNKALQPSQEPQKNTAQLPRPLKRSETEGKLDNAFYKERDLLQTELSEHKNRIHKLQQDIMAAMKMFEESKEESEVNKTKFIQSQNALNELIQQQKKLREEYQKEIETVRNGYEKEMEKVREGNQKEIQLIRSGYEADLKILRETMEEQKIKNQENNNAKNKSSQELEQLKNKIKQQDQLILELTPLKESVQQLKNQIQNLNDLKSKIEQEKQTLEKTLNNKNQEIMSLENENETLKAQITQLTTVNPQVATLQNKILELSAQLEKQISEKGQLALKIEDVTAAFEEKITRMKNQMTARPSIPEPIPQMAPNQEQKEAEVKTLEPQVENSQQTEEKKEEGQAESGKVEEALPNEALALLQAKVKELTETISTQQAQIAEYEQMVASQKLQFDMKMESLLQQLQTTQSQNQQLLAQVHENIKAGQPPPLSATSIDEDTLKLCEHLKEQNSKIAEQLQTLKKAKDEEVDVLTVLREESQKMKEELMIACEQKKMNEIELGELKQEREVLRETIQQLRNEKDQRGVVVEEEEANITNELQDLKIKYKEIVIQNQMLRGDLESLKVKEDQQRKVEEISSPELPADLPLEEHSPMAKEIPPASQVPEAAEQTNVADSLRFDMTVDELKDKPTKIENENEVIEVTLEPQSQPEAPQQTKESPPCQVEPSGGSRLNVNLNIEERGNSQGEPSQRHNYNFGENLTNEQLNQIGQKTNNHDQHTALKEQNLRLKEELDEIKSMKVIEPPETKKEDDIVKIQVLEEQKKGLEEALLKMKDQLSKMSQRVPAVEDHALSAPVLAGPSSETPSNAEEIEQYTKALASEREANSLLTARITDLEHQLAVPAQNQRSYILIRDLEDKLSSLEDQMKIKDDLLADTERTMQENYAVKYELADLKEKLNELQVALTERDAYVNELEEIKQYLSKEIEVLQQQKQLKEEEKKEFEFRLEKVENSIDYGKDNVELKNELDALNGQMITLNNENIELKAKISEQQILKGELQNVIQASKIKQAEFQSIMADYEAKLKALDGQQKKLQEQSSTPQEKPVNQKEQCVVQGEKEQLIQQKNERISTLEAQLQLSNQLVQQKTDKITAIQAELATAGQSLKVQTDELKVKDQKITDLQADLTKSNEVLANLSKQLEESNFHLAEFKRKIDELSVSRDLKSDLSKLVENMPNLEVHSIESRSEAPPLNYSRQDIPLDQLALRTPAVSTKQAVSDQGSPLPSPRQSPDTQSLKQELLKLRTEVKNKEQEIASLTFDLSQESEQKCIYFNEIQRYKEKVLELESDNKYLKEQGQRFAALPLQSFDTNPKFGAQKVHEVISEDHREHQPSIVREVLVRGEVEQTPHRPSASFDSPKQKNETQTRLETNLTYMSQQELEFLKKEMQIVKQELQSEKKLHYELQQIHKVCDKKYQILETRYQNCNQQLDFYQLENQDIIRNKKSIERELFALREQIAKQKEDLNTESAEKPREEDQNIIERANGQEIIEKANGQEIIEKANGQETIEKANGQEIIEKANGQEIIERPIADHKEQENVLMKAAQTLSGVPLCPLEQNPPVQQPVAIAESDPSPSGNRKLLQLEKSQRLFREKALLLEQNIENLEKALQEQIEINQTNQKLAEKLQSLNELQSMAQQFRLQREEILKQNQELKLVKEEYISLKGDKGDLTKIIEEHALWSMQRVEWEEKLTKIEENLVEKENQFQEERQQLEQQVQTLQEKLEIPSAQKDQNDLSPMKDNKAWLARQQTLIKEIQEVKAEKLQQLQKMVTLEEKLNKVEAQKLSKEGEYSQALIQKENQVEELKFAIEQVQRDLEEHKVYLNHFDNQQQSYNTLELNYKEALEKVQQTNQELEGYAVKVQELEGLIQELKGQIKTLEDQNAQGSNMDQLSSEVDRLQLEIANKVQYIQELQAKNTEISTTLKDIELLLQEKEQRQKEMGVAQEQKKELSNSREQLSKKVQELESELTVLNEKLSVLQKEKVNLSSSSQQQQKYCQTLKTQLTSKKTEVVSLQKQYKLKEEELLALSKELEALKTENRHHTMTLSQLSEKESLLKQTLTILESESKKMIQALKERYKSEQMYYQNYLTKEKECAKLLSVSSQIAEEIANKERLLQHERTQVQKLKNQIQVLQKGEEEKGELPTDENVLKVQYSKYEALMQTNDQLMNKNREYLQMLGTKSTINIENQRLKNQIKNISSALTQINSQYTQFRTDQETETKTLMQRLKVVEEKRDQECSKVQELTKALELEKETKESIQNAIYLKMIQQKNQEIQKLRKLIEDSTARTLQQENSTKQEDNEETKAQIEALQAQIASLKSQLPTSKQTGQVAQGSPKEGSGGIEKLSLITSELQGIITQIRALFSERSAGSQSLYQTFLQKYDQMEEQFLNLNNETSLIQEKARFISKELQKIKAHIIKSQNKVHKEKTELLALIRPCENAAGELVTLSQTLSERDSQSFL